MSDELSGAVERLRSSTQHLNQICDQAAQLIRDVETFLEESRVGLQAYVPVCYGAFNENADEPDWEDELAYCRVEGKFRIAYVRSIIGGSPGKDTDVRPWSECTRDEKLGSLAKLPELLIALAQQAEDRTRKAEQALATVGALVRVPPKKKGAK